MRTAGAPTGLVSTEFDATSQVCFESVPPRLAGFCGAAQSLPLPMKQKPPVFATQAGCATRTPWMAGNVCGALPGSSTVTKDPMPLMLLVVTPPYTREPGTASIV